MASIVVLAGAALIGGIGLSNHGVQPGVRDSPAVVTVAQVAAVDAESTDTVRDVAAKLSIISDMSRAYETAARNYTASFTVRNVSYPSTLRARMTLQSVEDSMSRGVKLPAEFLATLREEAQGATGGQKETLTTGVFWEDGRLQAAEWEVTTPSDNSPTEITNTIGADGQMATVDRPGTVGPFFLRYKAVTDHELTAEVLYTVPHPGAGAGSAERAYLRRGDRFRAEPFRLKRWSNFIGTPLADFLGDTEGLLSVFVTDETVDGEACYRVHVVRPHPGEPEQTDAIELLINTERGYLPQEITKVSDRRRTVRTMELARHGSGMWIPVVGRLRAYTRGGDAEELSNETTVRFEDVRLNVEFPARFASALPQPGTKAREIAIKGLE